MDFLGGNLFFIWKIYLVESLINHTTLHMLENKAYVNNCIFFLVYSCDGPVWGKDPKATTAWRVFIGFKTESLLGQAEFWILSPFPTPDHHSCKLFQICLFTQARNSGWVACPMTWYQISHMPKPTVALGPARWCIVGVSCDQLLVRQFWLQCFPVHFSGLWQPFKKSWLSVHVSEHKTCWSNEGLLMNY